VHVLIVAAARHPLRQPFAGGLESLTWELAHGLRERGVEVSLFAGPGSDPGLGARLLDVAPLDLSAAARADVSMPPEAWLREHHAYLQVMVEVSRRSDVDVVHNNSLHHLPVALAGMAACPVLTTLHTPPTPWLESAIGVADPGSNRFVAVSHHTASQWAHVAHADVVPNGVDVDAWRPGPGGPDLVWTGRLVPEKAPHEAVAIATAAGRRIRLAGPVGDRRYFDAEVAPLLGPRVEYVGHLDRAALSALVGASAACVVTPAWDEPYGLVAAEAMACGTPVVGYRRGGLAEFVHGDGGVLVHPGDRQAASEALDQVGPLDRRACREHAVRHCSLERMVDRYVDLYAELCARPRAA
jgi:glycosyltransferase involved in cell wall biosynthesis